MNQEICNKVIKEVENMSNEEYQALLNQAKEMDEDFLNNCIVDSCKFLARLCNQGMWWCELQRDKKPYHLKCDCLNCPDYNPYSYEITTT